VVKDDAVSIEGWRLRPSISTCLGTSAGVVRSGTAQLATSVDVDMVDVLLAPRPPGRWAQRGPREVCARGTHWFRGNASDPTVSLPSGETMMMSSACPKCVIQALQKIEAPAHVECLMYYRVL